MKATNSDVGSTKYRARGEGDASERFRTGADVDGDTAVKDPGDNGAGRSTLIKVVYFDEESASDYLDITAGGKSATTSEEVKERAKKMQGKVETSVAAKLSWLPFIGASAASGAGIDVSSAGRSLLNKTLSNTVLTDYLAQVADDERVVRMCDIDVSAPPDSMAYVKMFTPYLIIMKTEEQGVDIARLDEALAGAKGYYELLGTSKAGSRRVLRFNISAFRNNYGLADLGRMRLVFHGVLVGRTSEHKLGMEAEMSSGSREKPITAAELLDGVSAQDEQLLDVYDVILAGVEHVE